jgi:hypothetical protein
MDDGVLISLEKIIEIIQSFGFGLDLNPPKCEIFPLDKNVDLSIFPEEIERISELSILGCPITHKKRVYVSFPPVKALLWAFKTEPYSQMLAFRYYSR